MRGSQKVKDFLNLRAYNFVVFYKLVETTNLKLPIRKRRFFSHPVIMRGLMPRSAVLSKAKELIPIIEKKEEILR